MPDGGDGDQERVPSHHNHVVNTPVELTIILKSRCARFLDVLNFSVCHMYRYTFSKVYRTCKNIFHHRPLPVYRYTRIYIFLINSYYLFTYIFFYILYCTVTVQLIFNFTFCLS